MCKENVQDAAVSPRWVIREGPPPRVGAGGDRTARDGAGLGNGRQRCRAPSLRIVTQSLNCVTSPRDGVPQTVLPCHQTPNCVSPTPIITHCNPIRKSYETQKPRFVKSVGVGTGPSSPVNLSSLLFGTFFVSSGKNALKGSERLSLPFVLRKRGN